MERKLFITAIGGDIGCAVLKCLREEYGEIDIIGCDITRYNAGINLVSKFYIVPPFSDGELYWESIISICIKEKISHYLPMTEPEILIAESHRDFFKSNNIKLMINDSDILKIAMNKYMTIKHLEKYGLKVPITWRVDEVYLIKKFPVIVKSEQGSGSSFVRKANNVMELNQYIKELENPIIQQYIDGDDQEYTAGIFSDGKIINSIAFCRKLGTNGMTVWAESINDPKLNEICNEIAKIFDLKGSINIQLRKNNNEYYLFEINPRISSTVGFRYKIGFKDLIWWLDYLDKTKSLEKYEYTRDIIGVKTYDEVILSKS